MSAPVHHKYGEPRLVQLVVVDQALSKRRLALLGHAELVVLFPGSDPVDTAKTGGLPCVHCWHSDCMLASFVGSKVTIIGLILRPLMPPALLIWFT